MSIGKILVPLSGRYDPADLMSRSAVSSPFGKKIAVAWNGTSEVACAVGTAMALLTHADEVVVISINEDGPFGPCGGSLAHDLQWQGIASQTVMVDGSAASTGQVLLEPMKEAGSDMQVMGAYTRNRVRRVIFGGSPVTCSHTCLSSFSWSIDAAIDLR